MIFPRGCAVYPLPVEGKRRNYHFHDGVIRPVRPALLPEKYPNYRVRKETALEKQSGRQLLFSWCAPLKEFLHGKGSVADDVRFCRDGFKMDELVLLEHGGVLQPCYFTGLFLDFTVSAGISPGGVGKGGVLGMAVDPYGIFSGRTGSCSNGSFCFCIPASFSPAVFCRAFSLADSRTTISGMMPRAVRCAGVHLAAGRLFVCSWCLILTRKPPRQEMTALA